MKKAFAKQNPHALKFLLGLTYPLCTYFDEYFVMSHCQGNAKIGVQWQLQGAIAGDHFYYKRERNIVLQLQ